MATYIGTNGDDVNFGGQTIQYGLGGNDVLRVAGAGSFTLFGGEGNDFLIFAEGVDASGKMYGEAGNDFLEADAAFARNDEFFGGDGDDNMWGYGGNDTLLGGAGNDLAVGGDGDDTLYGEDGNDRLAGGTGTNYLDGGAGDDELDGDIGNDTMLGGTGNDTFHSREGNDALFGGDGNDILRAGEGADWIDGGAGFDYAVYTNWVSGVVVRLDVGMGVGGEAQGDTLINIEGVLGSALQDFLIGDSVGNVLFGQDGDDWLYGQGGADQLYGGNGSDQIIGGSGADYLSGGAGNDQFWTLAADFEAGVFDVINDFGSSAGNFDYLRFEGIDPARLTYTDVGSSLVISTDALGGSGGIIISNFSTALLGDHLIFA
ncbi:MULTISPECIES: calcium-binding protein [unclassified Bosea (in: a-proteobacteria)]|uniref:calcium-binding protein n=1 Tax=unclassified Bosea (in: a-proteobacteria) TaxID=2653178 RepID=UPI000F75531C|nr:MULTISPECIES: calcium-binding protein [unclassified Bosea (in: a-proteobacteria)]AZO79101.1 hypothetical protein BLM15_16890 [Bosea sp. Tri-49]RXT27505.1 hypothetical protein B5U98_01460 [Bosea sp. Tri-39]RXT35790.1 hypothetical protein B5U99_16540 [Bosea sp. Tri-54]